MTFFRTWCLAAGLLFLCSVLVGGCTKERKEVRTAEGAQQTLLIGLLPEQDIFRQVHRYEPLAGYLSKQLGMSVKLTVIPGYEKALSSFTARKMDAAFFDGMSYILAHTRLGVRVLARPMDLDGNTTYHGVIFVRTDSGIRSIRGMKGKRFAFVDENTMAGYYLPRAYFKKHGVDHATYLKEFYFAGTYEDVVYDVLDHKADIGAVKDTVLSALALEDERVRNELQVLEQTPTMPENALVVRNDLDASLSEKIKTALLTMHTDPEGALVLKDLRARQFIETKDRDYASVYSLARQLGIDLQIRNDATSR
jgi:phosphonate transport system substrate-binding protein